MKKPLHPELGLATRKLRSDALMDYWPLEQRQQILDWIAEGRSLRTVAALIEEHFDRHVHHTTVGNYYNRERKREMAMDYNEVTETYQQLTRHAAALPLNMSQAMQRALGLEFMRAYSTSRLAPGELLRYCEAIYKQRQVELRAAEIELEMKQLEREWGPVAAVTSAEISSTPASPSNRDGRKL